jgi:glycosyltransferase involved in cell wall biosynthesis
LKLRAIFKSLRAFNLSASAVDVRDTATWLIKSIGRLYGIVKLSDMLCDELDASERQVVFQPRAWNESSEGKRAANAYRGEIVRLLRAEFGSSDRIGFTHSKVRSSVDPGLQLSRKVTRPDYVRQLANSAIGVNTRGLNDSSTFKLSEYLAAGMAIVSDPMKFELPEPLVEGVHYLGYNSPSECVQRCRELVAKPDLLLAMRTANREYFKRNLDPEAQVRYLINATFEDLSAGDAR